MKATTIIAGTVVTASVAYIGYRIYRAAIEEASPINERRALDPKDVPPIVTAEKELPSPKVVPSGKVIQFRQDPEARVAINSAPMIALTVPFPTRSNEQRTATDVAAMFRRDSTPAEYDIFGNRTR